MAQGVKFVRIHGRIVPIKNNPGDQKGKKIPGVKKPGIVPHVQKEAIGSAKHPYSRQFKLGLASAAGIVGSFASLKSSKPSVNLAGAALGAAGAAAGIAGTYYQFKGGINRGEKKGFGSGLWEFMKQGWAHSAGTIAGVGAASVIGKGFKPLRQNLAKVLRSRRIAMSGLKIIK